MYEHHWQDTHARGRDAALGGDFTYVMHVAAEAGCVKCVNDLLRANAGCADELVRNGGTSGWCAAAWAEWGVKQAVKEGDFERAALCRGLHDHLERMKVEGVQAVLDMVECEGNDSYVDDDDEVEDVLPLGDM